MAFVMIATGTTSRSRVRTLPVRPLIAAMGVAALALLASGGAVGYWIAELATRSLPSSSTAAAAATSAEPLAVPFTLEQVGAISARLFRLESEAAQLSRKIGVLKSSPVLPGARAPAREAPAQPEANGASGGPLLPARTSAVDLGALNDQLARIQTQITMVANAAAQQSFELMRLPTRLPIAGAELTSTFGNRADPFAHTHAFHAGIDLALELLAARLGDAQSEPGLLELLAQLGELGARRRRRRPHDDWHRRFAQQLVRAEPGGERDRDERDRGEKAPGAPRRRRQPEGDAGEIVRRGAAEPVGGHRERYAHRPAR